MSLLHRLFIIVCCLPFAGCWFLGSTKQEHAFQIIEGTIGQCGEVNRTGIIGSQAKLERHDRDLNGDNVKEVVTVDRELCTDNDNCYWNMFSEDKNCLRYIGTIRGTVLERLDTDGDDGFSDLRTYWDLSQSDRFFLEEYRFYDGGYHVLGVLLCRHHDSDQMICSSDHIRKNYE